MTGKNEVDPLEVLLEQPVLDAAENFVSRTDDLNELGSDQREFVVDRVARMIKSMDIILFTSEIGTSHGLSLSCQSSKGEPKVVAVLGEKVDSGVDRYIILTDHEGLKKVFED